MSSSSGCGQNSSLANLPYELLHEVVSYYGSQNDILKGFRVIWVLSRVNKRLRDFALSIMFRTLNVSVFKFDKLLEYFSAEGERYASHVM